MLYLPTTCYCCEEERELRPVEVITGIRRWMCAECAALCVEMRRKAIAGSEASNARPDDMPELLSDL